jgi:hypothetical protein
LKELDQLATVIVAVAIVAIREDNNRFAAVFSFLVGILGRKLNGIKQSSSASPYDVVDGLLDVCWSWCELLG